MYGLLRADCSSRLRLSLAAAIVTAPRGKLMILSNDTTSGKGKKAVTTKGERTKATAKFNADADVPAALRAKLLNAVVHIDFNNKMGTGSGVILNADSATNKAYVLTAKHLLYIFDGSDPAAKKPADITNSTFINKLKIYYAPTALQNAGASGAVVSAVDYTGSDDQTWENDIIVLEINDAAFHTHVTNNRFLPADVLGTYAPLLKAKKGTFVCDILDKTKFIYLQVGYGSGRDKDVKATSGYEELKGKIQCRWPQPEAKSPSASAFEVDKNAGKVKSTNYNLCFLTADDTNSTGEGDSGGPLFALPLMMNQRTTFYLVGVTTGANYLTEQKYKNDPSTAPGDDKLYNNVITYWDTFCNAWAW